MNMQGLELSGKSPLHFRGPLPAKSPHVLATEKGAYCNPYCRSFSRRVEREMFSLRAASDLLP